MIPFLMALEQRLAKAWQHWKSVRLVNSQLSVMFICYRYIMYAAKLLIQV